MMIGREIGAILAVRFPLVALQVLQGERPPRRPVEAGQPTEPVGAQGKGMISSGRATGGAVQTCLLEAPAADGGGLTEGSSGTEVKVPGEAGLRPE